MEDDIRQDVTENPIGEREDTTQERKVKLPAYLRYWNLDRYPFALAPDPSMIYMSKQHQECLVRLKFAVVSGKGGSLLISENAGDGKTTLLNKFMQTIEEDVGTDVRIAFLDHPTLSVNEMLGEIARQFGVADFNVNDKISILNNMRQRLIELNNSDVKCIVVIDEGQMLAHNPEMLQELRILMNLVQHGRFLLSFILSGQKPLEPAIRNMPEFWQRLPVRFFLRNLDYGDTKRLIQHRIRLSGGDSGQIFSDTATKGIYNFSEGCPRVILSIADLSLVIGHSMHSKRIDFAEVSEACGDMNKGGESYHYFNYLNDDRIDEMADKRRKCPFCESLVDENLLYCPNCNFLIDPKSSPATIECIHCGVLNKPGSTLCSFCGKILMVECPFCGGHNPPARKACGACGYMLGSQQAGPDPVGELKNAIHQGELAGFGSVDEVRDMFVKEEPLLHIQTQRSGLRMLPAVSVFQDGRRFRRFSGKFTVTDKGLSLVGKQHSFYAAFSDTRKVERTIDRSSRLLVTFQERDEQAVFDLPLSSSAKSQLTLALNRYVMQLQEERE